MPFQYWIEWNTSLNLRVWLKRLIARKGRPKIIYSNNAKPFKAGIKLLHKINRGETFHHYLNQEEIGGDYIRWAGSFVVRYAILHHFKTNTATSSNLFEIAWLLHEAIWKPAGLFCRVARFWKVSQLARLSQLVHVIIQLDHLAHA